MESDPDLPARLAAALAEGARLRAEVRRLEQILNEHSIRFQENSPNPAAEHCLPTAADLASTETILGGTAKISLFRSLFRGREDVYAERWRTKDGKWAYRPAGKKDWQAILTATPENRRDVNQRTRILFPMDDEVIRQHLTGKKTVGIYPLLLDETCWLIAADFDKTTWKEYAHSCPSPAIA